MKAFEKKTLGIFSLTCCEGCQFALLSDFNDFAKLNHFYEIKNFRLGQEDNLDGPYDVALVEGTPESVREFKLLRRIRRESKLVIAFGACAHLGGIQSERNRLPKKYLDKKKVKNILDVIKCEFIISGCPISHKEAFQILVDIYFDKKPRLADFGVCFECRQNENKCLIKENKPCLGPITRGGCDSVCVNGGEACLGCRGPLDQANFQRIREILNPIISEAETNNFLTIYGDLEDIHKEQTKELNE